MILNQQFKPNRSNVWLNFFATDGCNKNMISSTIEACGTDNIHLCVIQKININNIDYEYQFI
jgi:hypothetical protein